MLETISLTQVLTLSTIHLISMAILYAVGWFLLPSNFRIPLAGMFSLMFGASLIGLLTFYAGRYDFFAWLFDPAAERNSIALLSSTLLLIIGISGLSLLWGAWKKRQTGMMTYFLILGLLFTFLALDEYLSLHETIIFWRAGYLILGGTVGLLSLLTARRSDTTLRPLILIFTIGLGVMGVSGVVLDAFSTRNLLDIGPLELTFIQCNGTFLGVICRDYGNTEEFMELLGESLMCLSLLAIMNQTKSDNELHWHRRWVYGAGIAWAMIWIVWIWLLPEIESRFATPAQTDFGAISLISYRLDKQAIQPGETLNLNLYMQADESTENTDYSISVHLYTRDESIASIAGDDLSPTEFIYPTGAWLPRLAVRNQLHLDIPDDLDLNQSYQLIMIVWEGAIQNRMAIQESILPVFGDGTTLVLDGIAAPDSSENNDLEPLDYRFDAGFSLRGIHIPETVSPGDESVFDFLWEVDSTQSVSATHFMHWFHVDTGEYVIFDQIPRAGTFPVQDWVSGMSLLDEWAITIPDDIPPGRYRVQTGLYDTTSIERLPVNNADGSPVQDNSIVIAEIEVQG